MGRERSVGRTDGARAPLVWSIAALVASAVLWIAGGDGTRAGAVALLAVAVALVAIGRRTRPTGAEGAEEGAASDVQRGASARGRFARHGAAEREHDTGTEPALQDAPPEKVLIEDAIDLHGFAPRDVLSVVEAYLEAAHERGFREVRLIHGRGKGVQRERVRELLARHPLVERYATAPASRGGWGATLAWLAPKCETDPGPPRAGKAASAAADAPQPRRGARRRTPR